MKQIILCSFFNSNNIGDKAIADILTKELSKFTYVQKCSNEGSFDIVGKYESRTYSILERILIKLFRFLGKRFYSRTYKEFLKEFEKKASISEAIVIGGGNIMMEYTPKTCPFEIYSDIVRIANNYNKKVFCVAIGIGPFSTQSSIHKAVSILNSTQYVSFRDSYSYDLFIKNGGNKILARKTVDPVLCGSNRKERLQVRSSHNNVGINIIYPIWKGKAYANNIINGYCKIVNALLSQNENICITIFITEKNDSEGINIISSLFNNNRVTVEKPETLEELIDLYHSLDCVIGARMHSLIIAFSNQIPVFGLSWERKVDYFFETIQMQDRVIDINSIDDNVSRIVNTILNDNFTLWKFDTIYKYACEQIETDMEIIRNAV